MTVGLAAAGDGEEFFLEFARDGASDAFADLDAIYGADGRDFDGRANEENFIHDVEHLARDHLFLHRNTQIFGELHDGVARDARQNTGGQRRRIERSVVNEEDVHAGAFANVAAGIEGDAFRVVVERSFHANELGVHVICRGFGHRGQSVRRYARPGADADINALCERIGSEIGAPGPASHVNVDRGAQGIHSHLAVTTEHDRLNVAGVQFVGANELGGGVGKLVEGVGKIHPINFRGIDEPLHVLAKAEDRGALLGLVAADAFEYGRAVAYDVREDMQLGIVPIDPFAVVPDFLSRLNRHRCSLFDSASRGGPTRNRRIRYAGERVNAPHVLEPSNSKPIWRRQALNASEATSKHR